MAKGNRARKVRTPEQLAAKTAKAIGLDQAQIAKADLVLAPVANWTDADQRHMVRSEEKSTVRRLTRIERLVRSGTIERGEAAACEAYAEWHALGYDTVGCTANYLGAGGSGFGPRELWARYRAQEKARENYLFARQGIPPMLLAMFEGVVLHGRPMASWRGDERGGRSQRATRLSSSFRHAVQKLASHIAHLLPMEA